MNILLKNLCECGCGAEVKNRFVNGHSGKGRVCSEETRKKIGIGNKGKPKTEEHKRKLSEANKGKKLSEETKAKISKASKGNTYALGFKHTDETKEKVSKANKGKILTEETKQKMSKASKGKNNSFYGKKHTDEAKAKMSLAHKGNAYALGYKHTDETKEKVSIANKGKLVTDETRAKISKARKGWVYTEETKRKLSKAHKGLHALDKNPNWRGGLSFEPYGIEFNKELKAKIRMRDNHTCQLCRASANGRKHHVHHIDYDKRNNDEDNLITLCTRCHVKTNYDRENWVLFFGIRDFAA